MDPVTALSCFARGIRLSLGDFAPPPVLHHAAQYLDKAAAELSARAREDVDLGVAEEAPTAEELVHRAAERRVADLLPDTAHRQVCTHTADCGPGCQHVLYLLLFTDRDLRGYAAGRLRGRAARGGRGRGGLPGLPPGAMILMPADAVAGMPAPEDGDAAYGGGDDEEEDDAPAPPRPAAEPGGPTGPSEPELPEPEDGDEAYGGGD